MHAARAIQKNRLKETKVDKEKAELRRPSAISQISRVHRSPAVSIDHSQRIVKAHNDDSDNLNFSYVGFIIAVFGAVPLIVGTFVEVPALWECGLAITLVGLFIGVVFWCTELCAEAKKFSQKKNQLSSRGRIEDSNLLQVPDRKFGNGLDSRRGSFQSDSVSLIAPMGPHFTPKHLQKLPPHLTASMMQTGSRNSLSQYSSSDMSKSDESSHTLHGHRANGHLAGGVMPPHPPPKLLLRGNGRKDDGRVVSLVQPDPGLDDDSDSDAETVIEAPTGKPKIIQVQSCQEKGYQMVGESSNLGNLLTPTTPTNPTTPTFSVENETVPPLNPMAAQHRTIRMPVMPQEIDKLQRCECGRYLLTERDKLVGIRLPGFGGGSSMPTTAYNSPSLTGPSGAGTAPATRKAFAKGPAPPSSHSAGALVTATTPDSIGSSENDVSSEGVTPISTEHRIISVNSNDNEDFGTGSDNKRPPSPSSRTIPPTEESVVQVEPSLNSSDLLRRSDGGKDKTEQPETQPTDERPDVEKKDSVDELNELLTEMTAGIESDSDKNETAAAGLLDDESPPEAQQDDEDDEFEDSIKKPKPEETVVQMEEVKEEKGNGDDGGSNDVSEKRKQLQDLHQLTSPSQHTRPTFLPLPVNLIDSQCTHAIERCTQASTIDENCAVTVMMSSDSSASTVVFLDGDTGAPSREQMEQQQQQLDVASNDENMESAEMEDSSEIDLSCEEEFTKLRDEDFDEDEEDHIGKLRSRVVSLEELLEKLERKQDSEVLAVVVQ